MRFHIFFNETQLPFIDEKFEWGKLVKRGKQRGDYQNPPKGTRAHKVLCQTWALVWPLLQSRFKKYTLQSQTLGLVPPGEPAQHFHCDSDGDTNYHTVIVPLTTEHDAGGTQFENGLSYLPVRGMAYCFNGAVIHRGAAHRGQQNRIYAAYVLNLQVVDDPNIFLPST
jgi:hypothetical protein